MIEEFPNFMLRRAINPVVVAPTVTAVGLAFFAYGFPVVGTCVEIGIPQFLVVVFFALVSKCLCLILTLIFTLQVFKQEQDPCMHEQI